MADQNIIQQAKNVIMDPETELGEEVTSAPFVLVALGYLAILAGLSAIVALGIWIV